VALLLACAASTLLVASLTPLLPLPLHFDPRPDVRAVRHDDLPAVGTLLFGLGPALKLSRSDVVADLKEK
jgi:hypothetical protein